MPQIQAGDLSTHYLEAGADAPLLLVHGNWATGSWWEPLLGLLPEGVRGIAPDLRGRGRSAGPDTDYGIPSLAGDLLALADALGLGRFHLIGHSLGAAAAAQLALEQPGRVRSLLLLAPPWVGGMPDSYYSPERQLALQDDAALFAMALKAVAPTAPDDAFWRRLVAEGHLQRRAATLGAQEALRAWRPGAALRAVTCPALVVGGALDFLITPAVCDAAAKALGARHVSMLGVGHSPNVEAPEAFARIAWEHLARE